MMEKARVNIFELSGTNYDIGYQLGKAAINCPQFAKMQKCKPGTFIKSYMNKAHGLTGEDLKELLLSKYPEGLCCHWYYEFFGTIKSMVFDVTLGKVDICWGGIAENGWKTYSLDEDMHNENIMVDIEIEHPDFDFTRLG